MPLVNSLFDKATVHEKKRAKSERLAGSVYDCASDPAIRSWQAIRELT